MKNFEQSDNFKIFQGLEVPKFVFYKLLAHWHVSKIKKTECFEFYTTAKKNDENYVQLSRVDET